MIKPEFKTKVRSLAKLIVHDGVNLSNTVLTGQDIPSVHFVDELYESTEELNDSKIQCSLVVDHSKNEIYVNLNDVKKSGLILSYLCYWGYFKLQNYTDSECDIHCVDIFVTDLYSKKTIFEFIENSKMHDPERKVNVLDYISKR